MPAKVQYTLVRGKDEPTIIDGWAMPPVQELLNLPYDASGSGKLGELTGGMELSATRYFKVVDCAADGNIPQILSCTVTLRRLPNDGNEAARIEKAVHEQSKRSMVSKAKRAEEIERSNGATLEAFARGQQVQATIVAEAQKHAPKIADQLRDAAELITAVKSFVPKALNSGE